MRPDVASETRSSVYIALPPTLAEALNTSRGCHLLSDEEARLCLAESAVDAIVSFLEENPGTPRWLRARSYLELALMHAEEAERLAKENPLLASTRLIRAYSLAMAALHMGAGPARSLANMLRGMLPLAEACLEEGRRCGDATSYAPLLAEELRRLLGSRRQPPLRP